MDGNNSLSRLLRRTVDTEDEEGTTIPGPSIERTDTRKVPEDYFLTRDKVDKWTKELLESMVPEHEVSLLHQDKGPRRPLHFAGGGGGFRRKPLRQPLEEHDQRHHRASMGDLRRNGSFPCPLSPRLRFSGCGHGSEWGAVRLHSLCVQS